MRRGGFSSSLRFSGGRCRSRVNQLSRRLGRAFLSSLSNSRAVARGLRASAVQPPVAPPCRRHRVLLLITGHWQGVCLRVRARQRGALLKFESRSDFRTSCSSWFMGLVPIFALPLVQVNVLVFVLRVFSDGDPLA